MKRIVGLVAAFLLMATSIPTTAFAEAIEAQGEELGLSVTVASEQSGEEPGRDVLLNERSEGESVDRCSNEALPLTVPGSVDVSISGLYRIVSAMPGARSLDIAGGSVLAGANVQLYASNNTPAQRFEVIQDGLGYCSIIDVKTGMALDLQWGASSSGTNVWQYSHDGSSAQKWKFVKTGDSDGSYWIVPQKNEDLCLDVSGGLDADGSNVQVWEHNGSLAQKFKLIPIERTLDDGVYTISNSSSGLNLSIADASSANGGNVELQSPNGGYAQRFKLTFDEETGYYEIENVNSAKSLDVVNSSYASQANVQQYSAANVDAQRWSIERASADGSYTLRAACGGNALDPAWGGNSPGTNVWVFEPNGTVAQEWRFKAVDIIDEGVYSLKSRLGTCLTVASDLPGNGAGVVTGKMEKRYSCMIRLTKASSGYYRLYLVNSGKVVEAVGGATSNGSRCGLYDSNGTEAQLWEPVPAGNGAFYFRNAKSGRVIDIAGGSSDLDVDVQIFDRNGGLGQQFVPVAIEDVVVEATYVIRSAKNQNRVLDARDGGTQNGTSIQLFDANGTVAQMFRVKNEGAGLVRLENVKSGRSVDLVNGVLDPQTGEGMIQLYDSVSVPAQKWRLAVTSDGLIEFRSSVDQRACIELAWGSTELRTDVRTYYANDTIAQKFLLEKTDEPSVPETPQIPPSSNDSNTTYKQYTITLDQMTALQMENQYITASKEEVRKALNPEHATVGSRYQFADLRGYSGMTASQLDAYIDSTSSGRNGMLHGMGRAFVEAAKKYRVNEAYLLAHAIVESGWGTSTLAKGYYYDGKQDIEGKYYPAGTYYNFYGIGAYDSSPLSGGRSLAIQNGWNTPEKAILGAASWIASNYTYRSSYPQPTLYDMKWDVARSNDTLQRGWHQYATDIYWARSIARVMDEVYGDYDAADGVDFVIPRYAG